MALSTRLTARQTQQLTMTPQLRQAIELLQMSSGELQRFIEEEVQKNPLLETDSVSETAAAIPEAKAVDVDRSLQQGSQMLPSGREYRDDMANPTENLAGETTLRDHLLSQINLMDTAPDITVLAQVLVHELDDDGYLRTPLGEIAKRLGAKMTHLKRALGLLQECDPTGVAARDLAECFTLQLRERGELTNVMGDFLAVIDQIASQPNKNHWKELGTDPETYADLLSQIKALNPAPGKGFERGFVQYAVPDVTVFRNNLGGWSVELNKSTLPAITINDALAEEAKAAGEEATKFITGCAKRADWLMRSIDQRSSTILKVAAEIVRVQEGFFSAGVSQLRPLTMRDVAEKVQINESTVSRVANSKYLTCERGTFELKFFFTKAIRSTNGTADMSSTSIQAAIRKLIEAESPKKVLSDDKIVKILNEDGVDIARRTVTKYREGMDIPSSVERRRFKSNLDKIR